MTPLAAAQATAWTVLHAAWQAAAVAALLAACLRLLPERAPRARYAAACAGMVMSVILPLCTAALATGASGSRPADSGAASFAASGSPAPFAGVLPWIGAVWMAGAALAAGRLWAGWMQTRRLRTADVHPPPAAWVEALRGLAARMGVRAEVSLRTSPFVDVPMVAGIWRPMILLPRAAADGLSAAQRDAVLAHELAHVRRRDALANLGLLAVEALLFFHPAVRWMSARARREREHCCDAAVVALGADAVGYARALATLEQLRPARRLALAATDGELLDRVRRLAAPETQAPGRVRAADAAALAAAGVLCLALGARAAAASTRTLLPSSAPARMEVRASDPAGEFTLDVERGRVVAASVAGVPVAPERLVQRRDSVILLSEAGVPRLAIQLLPDGIRWSPRSTSR